MSNITYRQYPNINAAWGIGVFLDRKLVGYIEREDAPDGRGYVFYYSPCNTHITGDRFDTVAEVKASLEED